MGASQSSPMPHSFDYGKKQGENVKVRTSGLAAAAAGGRRCSAVTRSGCARTQKMTDEYEEFFGDVDNVDECDQKIDVRKARPGARMARGHVSGRLTPCARGALQTNYETMVNSYYDMATDF